MGKAWGSSAVGVARGSAHGLHVLIAGRGLQPPWQGRAPTSLGRAVRRQDCVPGQTPASCGFVQTPRPAPASECPPVNEPANEHVKDQGGAHAFLGAPAGLGLPASGAWL